MATGTADWRATDLSIEVPRGATSLRAGLVLFGTGTAWFDDVGVTVEGEVAPLRALTFDADTISPLVVDERSRAMPFAIARDAGALRIAFTGDPLTGTAAVAAARAILDELRSREAAFAARFPADRVAWVVHNAEFVAQSFAWRADATGESREISMATNIKWLLDRAPANTKVVVWAHNGHVSRQGIALGAQLEKLYPGQMVNVGFTTSNGTYRAETPTGATVEFTLTPPPAGSIEEALAAAGVPRFVLDLRPARRGDAGAAWLNEARPFRFIGITGTDHQFRRRVLPREFDLLVYFDRTRASTLLK